LSVDELDVLLIDWLAGCGLAFGRYALLGHGNACVTHMGDGVAIESHVLHADGVVVVGHNVTHLHGVMLMGELDVKSRLLSVALSL